MTEDRNNTLDIPYMIQDEFCIIRRNSNGKIGRLNNGMQIVSRYLRPSLGSCHDFCKFGVEHTPEVKGVTKGHDLERTLNSAERKKNLVVRLKSCPASKMTKLGVPIVNGLVSPPTIEATKNLRVPIINGIVSPLTTEENKLSDQVPSPIKKTDLLVRHASDPKKKSKRTKGSSIRMQKCSNGEVQGETEIIKIKEMRNLSVNSQEVSGSRRKGETKRSKEVRGSAKCKRKLLVPPSISQSPETSLKRLSIQNAETSKIAKKISDLSNQKNAIKPKLEQSSSLDVVERTLHSVLKPKFDDPSSSSGKQSLKGAQIQSHTAELTTFSVKRNLRHSYSKINPTPSPPSYICPLSLRKTGLRDPLLGTRISQQYTSSLATFSKRSGTSSEHGEIDTENRTSDLKTEYNNKSRKGKTISLNDKRSPGQKLTFRREKMVDLQPQVSTRRRLKFRKTETMLGDSQNVKVGTIRKTVGKKEFDEGISPTFSEKQKLRRSQYRIQPPQPCLSWPPSPKKKGTLVSSTDYDETDHTEKQLSYSDKEYKNTHEMDGTTSLKEEFNPGRKQTVLHSKDAISSPRKQKCMQAQKILHDNHQIGKVVFGKKHHWNKKVVDSGEDTTTEKESKNLVLRHQDAEEKNSGSLFNNVIEETVSKLVKSRKSKVKALVGAFEIVISLQDIPNQW